MRSRPRLIVAAVVTALIGAALAVIPPTGPDGQANAANAANFDPGFLVSDEQFYDGGAMTAAEVQAFIDRTHPGCSAGYTCLDTYAQRTSTMPGDDYCDALPGRSNETAASIIARVGQACGISQRYLLVLLQKEQSLVTLRNPASIRYERATGFACPDTAPCDTSVGGFYYQVYFAARQFKRYAAHPERWAHRAGERNWVWWHPNKGCGSSAIFIRNAATAGLYNYTPYRPNQAALNNLYGSGDACSAYGNRNTWRIWTDWFGDPTRTLPSAKRLAGADRYATSVAASRSAFARGVPVVYLANGQKFPDGISAGAAAAHQGGPVLLTQPGALPRSVRDEIVRLQPRQVVIVGDRQSVSAKVEADVRAILRGYGAAATVTQESGAPADAAPVETAPAETAPAETAPAETAPVETAPVETAPVDAGPAETAPAETTPPETPPAETSPAETSPAQTRVPENAPGTTEIAPLAPSPAPSALPGDGPSEPDAATAEQPEAVDQPAASTAAVLRLGGANRYETSRLIAEHAFTSAASAFVATGVRFPDALAAGPAAARRNGPVLLVNGASGSLDTATRATLQRLRTRWVGVAGDTASVSAGITTGIAATGVQVTRYAGSDRYATAVQLAAAFGDVGTVYVASGQSFPDALAGAAAAGARGAPLLLTRQECMPEQTRSALIRAMPEAVLVLGGAPTIGTASASYVSCG